MKYFQPQRETHIFLFTILLKRTLQALPMKTLLILLLSISSLSFIYGQSVLEGSTAKASCCGQGGNLTIPCNPLPILESGRTYLIYIYFTLNGPKYSDANFVTFAMDIIKPVTAGNTAILPDSVKYYSVHNGNLGNQITSSVSVPRGVTKNYVAFTYFKFAPEGEVNIEFGTYNFRVRANGFISVNNGSLFGTPFSNTSDSYFEVVFVDPGEPCGDLPEPLEVIGVHNPTRTSSSFSIPPQWHPNPTQNSAILELELSEDSEVRVEIMDMQGRILMRPVYEETFMAGMNRRKLDVSTLASGIYYTRITTGTKTQVIKWVKLN